MNKRVRRFNTKWLLLLLLVVFLYSILIGFRVWVYGFPSPSTKVTGLLPINWFPYWRRGLMTILGNVNGITRPPSQIILFGDLLCKNPELDLEELIGSAEKYYDLSQFQLDEMRRVHEFYQHHDNKVLHFTIDFSVNPKTGFQEFDQTAEITDIYFISRAGRVYLAELAGTGNRFLDWQGKHIIHSLILPSELFDNSGIHCGTVPK